MRWGSTGNGSVGVGASAYTLASRDGNASYYYYQEPAAPFAASTTPQIHGQARRAKKPPDKRPTRKVAGPARPSLESDGPSEAADRPEGTVDHESEPPKRSLIMCAGKSVYGSTTCSDTGADEARSDNGEQLLPSNNNAEAAPSNQTTHFRSPATAKATKLSEPHSPPRQRTDEELEQIIRDLRQQVFQQQQQQQQQQQKQSQVRPKSSARSDHSAADADQPQKHHRKHLKNPVEKMERVAPSVPVAASIGSNSGVLLQRPLSSSYLNKIVAESTIQMVVPAIIYEAPTSTATSGRGGCRFSANSTADGQVSSLDFGSLRSAIPRSRPNSSSRGGAHHGGRQSSNPRHLRPKQPPGSMRIQRDKARGGQTGDEYSSDYDDSFLYLVDADGEDDWPESASLSPVGPWVVDNFASGVTTETPRSPSVSTCHSVSSLGSDDLECNDSGGIWSNAELSAMSPRSRLLYFSACADEVESSTSSFAQLHYPQTLRRSATCGSDLLGNTKVPTGTRPKRCSSAKTARHKGRTPNSASFSKGSKQKAPCRPNQVRKRPHSGATNTSH